MKDRSKYALLFLLLFLFRLFFGLHRSHWADYDERQSYLTGLKFHTTGAWPYFGPDAAGSESKFYSQIPGALEGLVVGLPFRLWQAPEAPFLLVNLLSTGGIFLLAWYIRRRLPLYPFPWLCLWLSVLPWSLHYPVHISNMSYVFPAGILFFIGFLESLPFYSVQALSLPWANAFMGFSFFWTMQFHLSYVFLAPFLLFSLVHQLVLQRGSKGFLFAFLGALPPVSLALPTYLHYGFQRINSHSGFVTLFNWDNVLALPTLLARFLSLACFEVPSFIGAHTSERISFLKDHPALLLPGALLWVLGILQALALLLFWFRKGSPAPDWPKVKVLTALSLGVVYGAFWFTLKPPLSHIYFVFFPLAALYSCYVWLFFGSFPKARTLAKALVVLGLFFQLGYAVAVPPGDSIEDQRDLLLKALAQKDYHLVGERSPGSLY